MDEQLNVDCVCVHIHKEFSSFLRYIVCTHHISVEDIIENTQPSKKRTFSRWKEQQQQKPTTTTTTICLE